MPSHMTGVAGTRATPQNEAIPGRESEQAANNAGGRTFLVDDLEALRRFLILGTETGTYYASERDHTKQSLAAVRRALDNHGVDAVEVIVDVSIEGRATKNDTCIFALAMAAGHSDIRVRRFALENLSNVCRTGTHLFQFCGFVQEFRGWGRGLRDAVSRWYTVRKPDQLAYQAIKYRQRERWTHDDVLRKAHLGYAAAASKKVQAEAAQRGNGSDDALTGRSYEVDPQTLAVVRWITRPKGGGRRVGELPKIIEGFEQAQRADDPARTAQLVRDYNLPREALLTEHLNDNDVWMAMLEQGMPITALVRNLATMTRNGLLTEMSEATGIVTTALADESLLRRGRVHPIALLGALATYQSGASARGSSTWSPVRRVVDALDAAFYKAFETVESSGKRFLLALDVSGSMGQGLGGMPGLSARDGSAAMALVTAATENLVETVGFTGHPRRGHGRVRNSDLVSRLDISPRQRLDDVVKAISGLPFGATDCALPMLYAQENKLDVDVICVYTDNETWAGYVHPNQALEQYRQHVGHDVKLIAVGMTSTGFTIADPKDRSMLDVVGFDTAAPRVMADFAAGRI